MAKKVGLYEQLIKLGCSNPLQCTQEMVQNGVTKFFDRNYNEVTVRLEGGKFIHTVRRSFRNAKKPNRTQGVAPRTRRSSSR